MADGTGDITKRIEELVQTLAVVRNTRLIYGKTHNMTKRTLSTLYSAVESVLKLRPEITLGFIGGEIIFEKLPLYTISAALEKFILDLAENGIEKITFRAGIAKEEIAGFAEVIVLKKGEVFEKGGYNAALSSFGVKNIAISKIAISREKEEDVNALAKKTYEKALNSMQELLTIMEKEKSIMLEGPKQVIVDISKLILRNKDVLPICMNLKQRDDGIITHIVNVLILTIIQAACFGVDKTIYTEVGEAAIFHDADGLLLKAGMLKSEDKSGTTAEQAQRYATARTRVLLETKGISRLTPLVAYNHARYGLFNYTNFPKTKKLNFVNIMITIACYYDNLILKARGSLINYEDIYLDIMKLKGDVLRSEFLDMFFKLVGRYPPGALLELNTGEIVLSVRVSNDARRPIVEVLTDESGNKLEEVKMLDLSEIDSQTNDFKYKITRALNPQETGEDLIPDKYK
jgi:HD-GYP domain-containing protein (c-di-GMP phosphodiesterase class II)